MTLSTQQVAAAAIMTESLNQLNLRTPQASARNILQKEKIDNLISSSSSKTEFDLRSLQNHHQYQTTSGSLVNQLTPMGKTQNEMHSQTPRAPTSRAIMKMPGGTG